MGRIGKITRRYEFEDPEEPAADPVPEPAAEPVPEPVAIPA